MAVDAGVTSVVLGQPGQSGSPQVVTAAGLVFTAAANPAAASPYWNYDGTNLVGNVPTGKGFSFTVNGSQVAAISAGGNLTLPVAATTATAPRFVAGTLLQLRDDANGAEVRGYAADSASAVAVTFAANADYSTAGSRLARWGDNASSFVEGAALFAVPSANPTGHTAQYNTAHIGGGSTAISLNTCRIGLGAGTTSSGTNVTASGHDMAGRIGVTVNSTGTVNQPILLVSFATAYATPPFVTLTPQNAATATIPLATAPFVVATTSGFSVMGNATGIAAGTYAWGWTAIQ